MTSKERPEAFHLRRADESDLPILAEMWMDMMREHQEFEPRIDLTDEAQFAYQSYLMMHYHNPKSLVAIAEAEGKTIAFCCAFACQNLPMFLPGEFGYLSDIFVVPEFRRLGAGTQLLDRVREWFRGQGIRSLHLQVYNGNANGMCFWDSMGFEPFFQRMSLDLGD
jgi:GNAT superfamily N-acetyltransferase